MYRRSVKLCKQCAVLCNLTEALCPSGALWEAEARARQALIISRRRGDRPNEADSLTLLGLSLAASEFGNGALLIENRQNEQTSLKLYSSQAFSAFKRALRIYSAIPNYGRPERVTYAYLAQRALWIGDYTDAYRMANKAWRLANIYSFERDLVRTAKFQGLAALKLGYSDLAKERFNYALRKARIVNDVEDELPVLIGLTELARQQTHLAAARDLLDDVWEPAERGPYPLFHADALNVLAQIERDAGNIDAAIRAATQAYRLAWCDGPPFAYHWGLQKAKAHLTALGAPFPNLPPFDLSKYEPMPEVEISPLDEFHVPE